MKQQAIEVLEEYFYQAYKEGKHVYVEVMLPLLKESEIIISKHDNILNKLEYYKKHYTDDLIKKDDHRIEIISFGTIHPASMPKGL